MNSTGLPPIHDLLGITTTTTEVSVGNKPSFPLNLTFWSQFNFPWKFNNNSISSTGSNNYEVDDTNSPKNSDESLQSTGDDVYLSGSLPSSGFNPAVNAETMHYTAKGIYEDMAQMVVPASAGPMFRHSTVTSFVGNISIIPVNLDVPWYLSGNSSLIGGETNTTDEEFSSPAAMSTVWMIITSVILGIMILTTVIGEFIVSVCVIRSRDFFQNV